MFGILARVHCCKGYGCVLRLAIASLISFNLASTAEFLPVILVPGLAGSVLEAKLNRTKAPHWYCTSQSDWRLEWLQLRRLVFSDCLQDELKIFYRPESDKKYSQQEGVEVRPYDFGGLDGVSAIDPLLPLISTVFGSMIDAFESLGYQPGKHLFGAPYDFRLAGDGLLEVGWFEDFKQLVEKAVKLNSGRRAVLVCHSMGCLVVMHFFNYVADHDWRTRYVARVISLSAPWEGSAVVVKASVSGDNFGLPFPHNLFRDVQSTAPSGPWLFPNPDVWGTEVMVSTRGGANYSAADAEQLLLDLGLKQQAALYPVQRNLSLGVLPVDVTVYCLFGYGIDTGVAYEYDIHHFDKTVPPEPSVSRFADGDGAVPFFSLDACSRYSSRCILLPLPHADHLGILRNSRYISMVTTLAGFKDSTPPGGGEMAMEEQDSVKAVWAQALSSTS